MKNYGLISHPNDIPTKEYVDNKVDSLELAKMDKFGEAIVTEDGTTDINVGTLRVLGEDGSVVTLATSPYGDGEFGAQIFLGDDGIVEMHGGSAYVYGDSAHLYTGTDIDMRAADADACINIASEAGNVNITGNTGVSLNYGGTFYVGNDDDSCLIEMYDDSRAAHIYAGNEIKLYSLGEDGKVDIWAGSDISLHTDRQGSIHLNAGKTEDNQPTSHITAYDDGCVEVQGLSQVEIIAGESENQSQLFVGAGDVNISSQDSHVNLTQNHVGIDALDETLISAGTDMCKSNIRLCCTETEISNLSEAGQTARLYFVEGNATLGGDNGACIYGDPDDGSMIEMHTGRVDITGAEDIVLTSGETSVSLSNNGEILIQGTSVNICGVVDPASPDDVANKKYVDGLAVDRSKGMVSFEDDGTQINIPWAYNLLGGSIARRLGNGTLWVATPDNDNCAANKSYVDNAIANAAIGGGGTIDLSSKMDKFGDVSVDEENGYTNVNVGTFNLLGGQDACINIATANDTTYLGLGDDGTAYLEGPSGVTLQSDNSSIDVQSGYVEVHSQGTINVVGYSGVNVYADENDFTYIEASSNQLDIQSHGPARIYGNGYVLLEQRGESDTSQIELEDGYIVATAQGEPLILNQESKGHLAINRYGHLNVYTHDDGGINLISEGATTITSIEGTYIHDVVTPEEDTDAANKAYVDTKQDKFADVENNSYGGKTLSLTGNTLIKGDGGIVIDNLDSSGNARGEFTLQKLQLVSTENKAESAIINLGMVDYEKSAANKGYVDSECAKKQDKFADINTLNGQTFINIPMNTRLNGHGSSGGTPISNIADPVYPQDVATKRYVDGLVGDIESALDSIITIQNSLIQPTLPTA